MAKESKDPKKSKDSLDAMSAEVDRLLKQLPGADPTLSGSDDQPALPAPRSHWGGIRRTGSGAAAIGRDPGAPAPPSSQQRAGVWLRVALGAIVGILMTQWPYRHVCGLPLYLYLGAVLVVVITGVWGSLSSWKLRLAVAHVLSLLVVVWGLVLGAAQVLPRVGYAATRAHWQCIQQ